MAPPARATCRSPAAELRLIPQQGEAAGDDPAAARESAARSIRAASAQPGALEQTVHHTTSDMPGRQVPVQLVAGRAARSRDLATATGVDQGPMSSSSSPAMNPARR
jgi:hypothetical protein